ncbi:amino acid ABC transporter permease [Specibacter cremeus]|uniref:amino acid ABC transporter permease n=1 Tax=Specibacter cremeus TaxID=1629051 RepID=UPI000F768B61|nr:amino acid ABC transporter permease [Specibacter cremeus]
MKFDWTFFFQSLLTPSPAFLTGLILTIVISVVSMALALVLGTLIALMGRSRFPILRWVAGIYVWIVRGTPLLVQLMIIYLGFAAIGLFKFEDLTILGISLLAAVQAAILGLTINESAYVAEIVRAGLESVDRGQTEASMALGMRPGAAMRWIILPQAMRIIIPPLGNNFNGLMKNTSVLSIIGVSEMFLVAQAISSATFKTFEILIVAAIYYLALTTIWAFAQALIERKLNAQVGNDSAAVPVFKRVFAPRVRKQLVLEGAENA